jgi:hypothetical protein
VKLLQLFFIELVRQLAAGVRGGRFGGMVGVLLVLFAQFIISSTTFHADA